MYFYYFLSSFGNTFRKYLWWKKYLTAFQMVNIRFIFKIKAPKEIIKFGNKPKKCYFAIFLFIDTIHCDDNTW
jgi:hypothetical protein